MVRGEPLQASMKSTTSSSVSRTGHGNVDSVVYGWNGVRHVFWRRVAGEKLEELEGNIEAGGDALGFSIAS